MPTVNQYRLRCITEGIDKFVWSPTPPTTCPTDTAHAVDLATITLMQTVGSDQPVSLPASSQADGALRVVQEGRQGSDTTQASHNLCDPTTWHQQAVQVVSETLTDSGDGLTFTSSNPNWIDLQHGKVLDERSLRSTRPVSVTVGGVVKVQRQAWSASGGDYTVDYTTGSVTFFASQAGSTVVASYWRAASSIWSLIPEPGKKLTIEQAEAQFSVPVSWNDAIVMDVVMYAAAIVAAGLSIANKDGTTTVLTASDLVSGGGTTPDTQQFPVAIRVYDSFDQLIDEARGSYPPISANGGSERGSQTPREGFPFWYGTVRELLSSAGMALRVYMENDVAMTGDRGTVTLYCSSAAE